MENLQTILESAEVNYKIKTPTVEPKLDLNGDGTLKEKTTGYVLAGFQTMSDILIKVQEKKFITEVQIKDFLAQNVNKYLISYGIGLKKGKPIDGKVTERFIKQLDKCLSSKAMSDCEVILDSGGYQLQCPMYMPNPSDTSSMIDQYHNLLTTQKEKYDWAFTLDVAPGGTYSAYDSWADIKKYNYESMEKVALLPLEVRKKMLFVCHMLTPKLKSIWDNMLTDGLADSVFNFSSGGLVSFSKCARNANVSLYVVSLISILNYAKQRGLKKFRYHFLGLSEFKDILCMMFYKRLINKYHGLDIEFTYDSSSLFKLLALGRFIYYPEWDKNQLHKLSLREARLDFQFKHSNKTNKDCYFEMLNDISKKFSIPVFGRNKLFYDSKGGKFNDQVSFFGMLMVLKVFADMERKSEKIIDELMPIYESGDRETFDQRMFDVFQGLNNNKLSKRVRGRACIVGNTLDLLKTLDADHSDYLIQLFTAQDECTAMNESATILF